MNKSLLIFAAIILLVGCTTLKNWVLVPEVTKTSSEAVWQANTLTKPQFEWVERDYKLLRIIHGHNDPVNSVSFANNGFLLASASGKEHRRVFYKVGKIDFDEIFDFEDYSIKLWDTRNGKLLRTLNGHTKAVASVAFDPDAQTLASCSSDRAVKLWDVHSGELLRTLKINRSYNCSVTFAPEGQVLASGGSKSVKLWDVRSGELLHTLQGHQDTVISLAFAPSGNTLASGSSDKTVKLWNIRSGKLLRTIGAHGGEIKSVDFAPNGKMLASGSWDGTVKLWDLSSGKLLRTMVAKNGGGISSVAFTPDSSTLASGHYYHKTVKLWDVQSGNLMRELRGQNGNVSSVAFASDGRVLASGSSDGTINFWRVFSARERDWSKFVAEYNSGNAGLDELAELAAIYPDLLPKYKELENYDTALSFLRAAANKNNAINKYLGNL